MINGQRGDLASESEILTFFSSYLRDILELASEIKKNTYSLLGLSVNPQRQLFVNKNVYSIMEACNHSYEDLRRTSTLLKGHIKALNSLENNRKPIR